MRLIIFYEHKVRELPSIDILKKTLELQGHEVQVFSISFEWASAYSYAKENSIDVLVVPWCYSEKHFKYFTPFLDLNRNVKIINFHHEQITPIVTEPVLLSRDEPSRNQVFHLCWSDYFKERLIESGVDKERIYTVGNLKIPLIGDAVVDRASLAVEYGLDQNKKWILFAESRRIDVVSYEKNKEHIVDLFGVPYEDYDRQFNRWVESVQKLVGQVKSLPDTFFDQYELIYRPHPATILEYDLGNHVSVIFDRPISDWLANVDIFCTWQSTSAFEAELAGLPVFVHECVPIPKEERMPGVYEYTRIKEIDEIDDTLVERALSLQRKDPIYAKYIGRVSADASLRYVNAIEDIQKIQEKPERVPFKRGWIPRMYLFEFVTRVFYRMGLIKKLKWPNTSYMMYDDIPYYDETCQKLHS